MDKKIIIIQKWIRGYLCRLHQLPLILHKIQKFIQLQTFQFSNKNEDGRINSCFDEDNICKLLLEKFNNKIKKPKIRMWYDILAFDNMYGWLPINIKTTTTKTNDNTGNLAMCVYAYTDTILDFENNYNNGVMSSILYEKLKNKQYNKQNKKDYYFIVFNKNDATDIIINSIKGLCCLTPNINNLPFQIKWDKNRLFTYQNITKKIVMFIECLQKPQFSWKERFITNIRILQI